MQSPTSEEAISAAMQRINGAWLITAKSFHVEHGYAPAA